MTVRGRLHDHLMTDADRHFLSVIYYFGPFELDTAKRELRENGKHRETEPKAFDVLCYLAEHHDRAVSKDELQDKLWPHTIVTETALTRSIMKARRAVGDDANTQQVIRTVHGHGYRFVANLDNGREIEEAEAPVAATPSSPAPRLAALLVAGLAIVSLLLFLARPANDDAAPLPQRIAILPIDSDLEDESLSWVRVGLMSLLGKMLEDRGLGVAGESAILSLVDTSPAPIPLDQPYLSRVQAVASASDVLQTTLTRDGNVYTLDAVLSGSDGKHIRRSVVADSVTTAAADLASVLAAIYSGNPAASDQRLRRVSVDPFVNEAYGRALDLELAGNLEEARTLFEIAARQAPEIFWLRYEIAICNRDLGEHAIAAAQFSDLLAEARAAADTGAEIATLNSIAVMHLANEQFGQAQDILLEALVIAEDSLYASDRATIHVNLALVARNRDEHDTAAVHFEAARNAFEEAEIDPTPSFLNNYAGMLLALGKVDDARTYSEQAVAGFRLRGQRRFEAIATNRLAKILRRQGDYDGALSKHEQAIAIHDEIGNAFGAAVVMSSMTAVYRAKGDFTRARLNALAAVDRADNLEHASFKADTRMFLAQVEEDLGNPSAALEAYRRAHDLFAPLGTPPGLRYAEEGIARTTLLLGDADTAERLGRNLLISATDANDVRARDRAMMLLGAIAEDRGDVDAALSQFETVYTAAFERQDTSLQRIAADELARLYLDEDLPQEARKFLPATASEATTFEQKRLLARLQYADGDTEAAIALLSDIRREAGEAWRPEDEALLQRFQN